MEDLNGLVRIGKISSINEAECTARVLFEDRSNLVSYDLRIVVPFAFADKVYRMYAIDEPVLCVFLPNDSTQGFILGSYYSQVRKPPIQDKNKTYIIYEDGTSIEYDKSTHTFDIQCVGDINILVKGESTIQTEGTAKIISNSDMNVISNSDMSVSSNSSVSVEAEGSLSMNSSAGTSISSNNGSVSVDKSGTININTSAPVNLVSSSSINIKSGGPLKIDASGALEVISQSVIDITGTKVNINEVGQGDIL